MTTYNIPVQHPQLIVPGASPAPGQLLQGQLAVHLTDLKLFTKDNAGQIKQIGVALSDLAVVATTGSYNDLLDKPVIPPQYVLSPATDTTLGGVIVGAGTGLAIDSSGHLTADVHSVAGKVGAVVLEATDVGLPNDLLSGPSTTVATKYLPPSVTGALDYIGAWDAATNSPTLQSGVGNKGDYYVVNVAGTTDLDGNNVWGVGDWAVYNGTDWDRMPNASGYVLSVNGKTGAVTLTAADLNLATVATTGSYTDLINVPATFPPSPHSHEASDIIGLATVATSGSYADLLNIPTTFAPPVATSSVLGGVTVSATSGLSVDGAGALMVMPASATMLGGVKAGNNITIAPDGTISASPTFTLDPATTSTLGGVIVGAGLTVDGTGKIALDQSTIVFPVTSVSGQTGNVVIKAQTVDAGIGNSLIANDGSTTGTIVVRGITAGSFIDVTQDVSGNLVISSNYAYTLPIATTSVLGGVKSGPKITVAADGTLGHSLTAVDVAALPITGGTMQGAIDMANNTLINVPDPVNAGDALNLRTLQDLVINGGVIG